MSRAWQLVRGGIRPAAALPGTAEDRRRRRRSAPPRPWVSPETRAEVLSRLGRGESPAAVAGCLGLALSTVQFLAIELG